MNQNIRGAIFDLDGVLVNTARYHYLAWKRLAIELGFDFTEQENERLKGVSRDQALEILLEIGGVSVSAQRKRELAALKNERYLEYIQTLTKNDLLPGVEKYLQTLRARGIATAIGSASKNTTLILKLLEIQSLFDVIIDGNKVSKAKPDPEVFLRAAAELKIPPAECIVFEDAEAGVQAARSAGMMVVGIGDPALLSQADLVLRGFWQIWILLPES